MESHLLKFIRTIIAAYCITLALVFVFQRSLLYVPSGQIASPAEHGLTQFQEVQLTTADNINITAWYKPAMAGHKTILHFHGNGGNLANWAGSFKAFADAGFGVLAVDYRGYGKSEGSPTEQGVYEDADTAMRYLGELGVDAQDVILFGESLGTGVAVQMATQYDSAGLVLISPYTSIPDVASAHYPIFPVRYLIWDQFDSAGKIHKVQEPVLVVHGSQDRVVPFKFGKQLFEAANEPKRMVVFPELGHVGFPTAELIRHMRELAK